MSDKTFETSETLLTPFEVATTLQVPEKTLIQWRYAGTGPAFLKIGRYVRYDKSEVARWLATRTRTRSSRAS